jgi:hypothetical protein
MISNGFACGRKRANPERSLVEHRLDARSSKLADISKQRLSACGGEVGWFAVDRCAHEVRSWEASRPPAQVQNPDRLCWSSNRISAGSLSADANEGDF